VIIERSAGLVVDRLVAAGHPVVPVHPTAFHAARPRWGAAGAKSDPGDSYKLADYLRTDGHRLRRLQPLDPGLRELQALVRLREDHVRARTAASNQLGALLDAHWPGPKAMFCKPRLPRRQATRRAPGPAADSTRPANRAGARGAGPADRRPGPAAAELAGHHRRAGDSHQAARRPAPTGQAPARVARGWHHQPGPAAGRGRSDP
jgi:hypothetical protein